jgi:hypothetical protein
MASYSMDEVELAQELTNYNAAKEAIVDGLVREGYLTEGQGNEIKLKYAVALVKNNWFGSTIANLINRKDTTVIKLVKLA